MLEGTAALWLYEHPFLGSFPALVTKPAGAGRISWLGTLPDTNSCASLLAWALAERGRLPLSAPWSPLPAGVRLTGASHAGGGTLWFVGNHSFAPAEVRVPGRMRDLTNHAEVGPSLTLGPWDSRVLLELG